MVKKIAIVILVLVVALLGYAATRPNTFHVIRWTAIKVPRETVFPLINDFHQWALWSPWEKLDPNMKRTYSGPASGVGAVYEWSGNSAVGAGRMEIIESQAPSKIKIKLDFLKPMEGHNTAEFTLYFKDNVTKTSWEMYGPVSYFCKVVTVFISMDKMIGADFEKGLANLKAVAEK